MPQTLQDSTAYPLWQYIITPPSTASSPVPVPVPILKDSSNVADEFRTTTAPAPQFPPPQKPLAGRGKAIPSKRSRAKKEIVGNPVKASLAGPKRRSVHLKLTLKTSHAVVPPNFAPGQTQTCTFLPSDLAAWFSHNRDNPDCYNSGDVLVERATKRDIIPTFPQHIWHLIQNMRLMDDKSILDSICWTIAAYPDRFVGLDALHLNVAYSRPDLTLERLVGILHTSSVIAKVVKGTDGMYHIHGLIPVRPDQEVFYAYWHFVDRAIGNHYRYNTADYIRKEMKRMTGLAVYDS